MDDRTERDRRTHTHACVKRRKHVACVPGHANCCCPVAKIAADDVRICLLPPSHDSVRAGLACVVVSVLENHPLFSLPVLLVSIETAWAGCLSESTTADCGSESTFGTLLGLTVPPSSKYIRPGLALIVRPHRTPRIHFRRRRDKHTLSDVRPALLSPHSSVPCRPEDNPNVFFHRPPLVLL